MLTEWYYVREALVDIRDNFILRIPNYTITKPTSAQANRGGLVREDGGTGVADKLYFSRKDAADAYAWVDLLGLGDAGPSSSVDSEVALFSGTTGKVLKRATGTGIAKITSGVLGTDAALTDLAGKWTPASSSGPASLALHEDIDNGSHAITLAAPASLAADYTQTLPAATGTIALEPTLTTRSTTGAAIANGAFQAITATCNAGEVCTGGGFAAVTSTLVRVSNSYPASATSWGLAWTNTSGSNAQMTVYAVCAKFGA